MPEQYIMVSIFVFDDSVATSIDPACGEAGRRLVINIKNMKHSTSRAGFAALTPLALASAFSTLGAAPAAAQSAGDKALAPVVVTAARVQQLQAEALPHTTVLSAQDIANSQAVDLPSLLRHEAGLQFTRNGGIGQSGGIFMRGAPSRQTLVLLDGVPLTKQDATGTVSLEHLMLDQIERIEIVRGNVSAIYGSGAIGGVIQVFTKRGDGPARVNATVEAGSRDTRRASAVVSGSSGGLRYSLGASHFRTDGFSAINSAQRPGANPDNDGYRNTSANGTLSTEWSKGQELGVRFLATEGKFDFDSSFDTPADVHRGETDLSVATLFSHNRITDSWASRVSYSEFRDRNANRYITAFPINDYYRTRNRTLQWNNEIVLDPAWTVTAGAEHQSQHLTSDSGFDPVFRIGRNADSVYAGIQGKAGAHQWQLNARHDRIENVDSATTGYLGYGYLLTNALKATASVSTAFNAPPLGYLYAPVYGNPSLKPEKARAAEVGLQYALQDTLLRATVFMTRTTEQLDYDFATSRFENISKARNKGLELSATGKWRDTDLRASLTLQNPRDDTTGERLIRRARTLASVSANTAYGRWKVGGDVDYTGARPEGSNRLGAYTLVNLQARYSLGKELSVFGRLENLFDREYQTAFGFNQPPRGVFVGLNWQQ
ncbi:MAG: TonB-dependent receptor [Noviherbaspirillum sp.]|nr:TonB-dependent receptor [Noviherbaspirillum sp.]